MSDLAISIPEGLIDDIADRVRSQLAEQSSDDPWFDVKEAAGYLRAKPQRIYDLTNQGKLKHAKDGSRTLIRRSWLDAYLGEGAP